MTTLKGKSVTVAGAGALGLAAAVRLADAGATVTLCDPSGLGDNASGVAAGMLAPAFECALDAQGGEVFESLVAARDLWPRLLRRVGIEEALDQSGAAMIAFHDETELLTAMEGRLRALGLAPDRLGGGALRRIQPGLNESVAEGLWVGEDWRLPPGRVLGALAAAFAAVGGRLARARLEPSGDRLTLEGRVVEGEIVIAGGAGASTLAAVAPELARLSPIKGQILAFRGGPVSGPVLRHFAGYLAPQPGGALAGASMEAGRDDRALDAEILTGLRARAARIFPALAEAPATGLAGVRATTPDGLPLVGRSRGEGGPVLCVGARRNGWLLAPLLAEEVVRLVAGGEAGRFDPARFD